jgi:hypothetical protein
MGRRRRSSLAISAEEAHQVLTFLVHEGKVAASTVQKALKHRERLILEVRERLAKLGIEGLELGTRVARRARGELRAAKRVSRPTRKRAISAAARKMYQQQGRYMAALRPLSKVARKKMKAIRERSGVNTAIAAAKRMAK